LSYLSQTGRRSDTMRDAFVVSFILSLREKDVVGCCVSCISSQDDKCQ